MKLNDKGDFTMEKKKRIRLSVEIDEKMQGLLQERMEYLQEKRPDTKITVSDAIRHAISHTGYKKKKLSKDE